MFNHKSRPITGRPALERLTPADLAVRIRSRRARRIATILVCTSVLASASYLGWQGVKTHIGASAAIPGEGILNVADLSWPDGSELDALIPVAGGQNGDTSPCADNDCGTSKGATKIALETSLDAMALQQLAMLEPQAGPQGGSNPDQPGTGSNGGDGGPGGNWGSGPNFPGGSNGGNGPTNSGGPDTGPSSFSAPGGPGGGSGPGTGNPPKKDGVCNPSNPSDPDCTQQSSENGDNGGTGGTGGTGGSNGGQQNLTNPNPDPGEGGCEGDCVIPVGGNEPHDGGSDGNPTSVPEPASLALFGAALAALGLSRRRRER